ncbi:MAG: hypothetical protein H7Y43_04365 [Akkermansiaceae bacterium]|nr:hypothetical protein [Verrucomicrobiales bacterium]
MKTMALGLMISLQLSAGSAIENGSRSPRAVEPASLHPVKTADVLSSNPSTAEIRSLQLFSEPLIPVGPPPSALENQQFAQALRSHQARAIPDDFSALENFIAGHAGSPWLPSASCNLSAEYYQGGWFSKALTSWEKSWSLLKNASGPEAKPLADLAAGELAYMYARLGRMPELDALLKSLEGRAFIGPATEKISGARQGLWTMQHQPEIAFRCGPMALGQILTQLKPTRAALQIIHEAISTTNGCSLQEVADLSQRAGLHLQMAYRSNGAVLLMPAVVNWKAGHYAALIKEESGLYQLQDPTFGNESWLSQRALDAESSGYFLVRAGALPAGWREVSEAEGKAVFGKGTTATSDADSTTGEDPKTNCDDPMSYAGIRGLARASAHLMVVSLNIQDVPVGIAPPVGPPVFFLATYNQREAGQPTLFGYANLGPKWTFNWLSYIKDNPGTPAAAVAYFTDAGGALPFSGFNSTNQTFAPQIKNQSRLKRTSSSSYELTLRTGVKIIFALPHGAGSARRVLMTQVIDPRGNAVNLGYDGSFRIIGVTNAIGQATVFSYEHPSDTLKITKVTDPFGRFATFSYDAGGRLAQITDVIGLTSEFKYDAGDFIQALITPYGTNTFEKGEIARQRWLVTTHPNGEKERVEYNENPALTGVSMSDPAATVPAGMDVHNGYLGYRNSFYWDRKAYAEAPTDHRQARLYHWLHLGNNAGGILESERRPFENRVCYTYDGQNVPYNYGTSDQPNAIGRVLDDGVTQLTRLSYDSVGNLTNSVDPAGRSQTFVYATNQIDLLELRQTTGGNNELISRFIYNGQLLPVAAQSVAGQWTTNTYNARGQLLSRRNPKGEITAYTYDASGYLLALDGPLPGTNDAVRFTYDLVGRVRSITDADGFAVTNSYDNLDRLTNITFPDGTFTAYTFDRLDRVKTRDRLGNELSFTYDSLRRMTSMRDALNRELRFEYCSCDALSALIDPLGRTTRWDYDALGRTIAKQFPDGTRQLYTYENSTSRVKSVRDEQGQVKAYSYFVDDTLKRISYPIAEQATPTVSFTYDPNYNRLRSRQDGLGSTTWTYHPVGTPGALRIATADGPWANDTVTFQYDALNRLTNRAIHGVAQAQAFDTIGRVTNLVNALGSFTATYDGPTDRTLDLLYPNGQTSHYDYFGNAGNRHLQRLTHRQPDNSVISRFIYERNPVGNITNWIQELGSLTNQWHLAYDAANQLLTVLSSQAGSNFNHAYSYDPAGNRLSESTPVTNRTFQYNALNQLISSSDPTAASVTYDWDAAHRLVTINAGTARTEFAYDGEGRRARILEKTNGVVQSERRYVWCGTELVEERDASNTVLRRFFAEGFMAGTNQYFYTRDHLRSVREVVDAAGQVQSRYAYAPFGARTALLENIPPSFGFTGHFTHEPSRLSLTLFRAYNSDLGRWLSRDPLGEPGGVNLHAYVANDPINNFDSLGLCDDSFPWQKFKQDMFDLTKITGFTDAWLGTWRDLLKNTRVSVPELKWLGNLDLALNAADLMDNPTLGKITNMALSLAAEGNPAGQWFNRGMTFGQLGTQGLYDYAVYSVGNQDAVDLTLADWGDNWFWQTVDKASDTFNQPLLPWR